jgi:hypothetical protein
MDILTFIATVVGNLAWPTAVIVLAIVFRRDLGRLIPALQRIRYGEVEVEFAREVAQAKQELEPLPPVDGEIVGYPPQLPEATTTSPTQYYRSLADVSPRAAILEAWLGFELAANAAIESLRLAPSGRPLQMTRLFDLLRQAELLTDSELDALTRLRALRNQVVHGPEPDLSTETIAEYALTLKRVTDAMQRRLALRLPAAGAAQ